MEFNVVWIRHAFSCGNAWSQLSPQEKSRWSEINLTDPHITKLGREYAISSWMDILYGLRDVGIKEKNIFPAFFCSILRRTMETANALNPSLPIYIIPHIQETGTNRSLWDVVPLHRNEKKLGRKLKIIKSINPYHNGIPLNVEAKYKNFYESIFPILYNRAMKSNRNTILIVSHGNYIEDATNHFPDNLGSILQRVRVTPLEAKILSSHIVFQGYTPRGIKTLDDPRIGNCLD